MSEQPLSPVEHVYMCLLHDFRARHMQGERADDIDAVIRYFEKRWPDDVKRYEARFSKSETR